jgi:DNA gyrase subunit A
VSEQPPTGSGDRVEPIDLQLEMQRSYLDYAMSVIVSRALPDVRDGLKPVHRRVLYAMYDGGFRPDRGYSKCSRVVGDVMGQYHPHGDSAIYDTLVRLAQPWSLRYPLIDGQGNFGSPGNDPAAAMRYCVVGDTEVWTPDGHVPIAALLPGAAPDSTTPVDLKVLDRNGIPVQVSAFHHSGEHPTLRLRTTLGHELTGTANHPVLSLMAVGGLPALQWRLLEELRPGDLVVLQRGALEARRSQGLPEDDISIVDTMFERGIALTPAERRVVQEPLLDGRFGYDTVDAVSPAGVRSVFSLRVDSDDHSFVTDGFVSHNTECRMAPLAMEMVRDIDKDTVDFSPNYDGRTQEPDILPSRFPNLLVNGSSGIAVGMATNIPPHNLREVADGVQWLLAHPDADDDELLTELLRRVKGPDFPTRGLIMGSRAIEDAYRTGRGAITMRAAIEVEEIQNRVCLVITELPYMVNPDNLKVKIAELVDSGRIQGIADLNDDTSGRTGLRIVIVLKRDAVAKVVLNNLYKHTQLQDTFGANMLALVDGVPRTLSLDKFVRLWVTHQVEVIVRRTRYLLAEAERQAHIYRGYVKALDALDEVIALIRASATVEDAREGLIGLLDIDEVQADAILTMQLRRLAALERQKITEELARLEAVITDLADILASPERQRSIISDELAEIVERYADDRRTRILPYDGDMNVEDLIPEEEVVVTITRDGYAKRTRSDAYRAQRRGGKGVRGAQLRSDDVVEHFFVTSTHHWLLFFTNLGRVYRAKAYELPEGSRDAKGQHVANLLAFQGGEEIAQVLDLPDYDAAPFLVLATKDGLVKKTRLTEYDSNRSGGVIAINLREGDEVVSARLLGEGEDVLLVSRKGMSVRFTADDSALRPMGRATSGVTGMKFRDGDELLSMDVVRDVEDSFVFVVTEGGYAKRTRLGEYRPQGRGGLGIKVAKLSDERGDLVGAMIVSEDDEVLVVMERGKVVRSAVAEVPAKGRDTMGVVFAKPDPGDRIIAVARNSERTLGGEENGEGSAGPDAGPDSSSDSSSDSDPDSDPNPDGNGPAGNAAGSPRPSSTIDGVTDAAEQFAQPTQDRSDGQGGGGDGNGVPSTGSPDRGGEA